MASMDTSQVTDSQLVWDSRYAGMRAKGVQPEPDPWLDQGVESLSISQGQITLDLGCGVGSDTRTLAAHGFEVVSLDFSIEALRTAQQSLSPRRLLLGDIREGLPFSSEAFQGIIANLSLHYFRWHETEGIVQDVRRCLRQNGFLLVRLNSINDVNFGAVGNPEVEPGLYLVQGTLKRFFDRESIVRLFRVGWEVVNLEERTTARYRNEKHLWEVLVQRRG